MQGIKKADMLSKKLGYKPVVYYTNGYSIFIIDQLSDESQSAEKTINYITLKQALSTLNKSQKEI